eukprot:528337-Rhodomonas_salina.3
MGYLAFEFAASPSMCHDSNAHRYRCRHARKKKGKKPQAVHPPPQCPPPTSQNPRVPPESDQINLISGSNCTDSAAVPTIRACTKSTSFPVQTVRTAQALAFDFALTCTATSLSTRMPTCTHAPASNPRQRMRTIRNANTSAHQQRHRTHAQLLFGHHIAAGDRAPVPTRSPGSATIWSLSNTFAWTAPSSPPRTVITFSPTSLRRNPSTKSIKSERLVTMLDVCGSLRVRLQRFGCVSRRIET